MTVENCRQHSDGAANGGVVTVLPAEFENSQYCPVTVVTVPTRSDQSPSRHIREFCCVTDLMCNDTMPVFQI